MKYMRIQSIKPSIDQSILYLFTCHLGAKNKLFGRDVCTLENKLMS